MERLNPIEQVEREPRPLPPETVTKILQAIPAFNLRDRTLFTLLYAEVDQATIKQDLQQYQRRKGRQR